ncbi:MAG: YfhO family protein, partial [Bacteroidota bacterium]
QADAFRSLLLVLLALALTYFHLQGRLKANLLYGGLAALTLFDVIGVGTRYLNADDFQRAANYKQIFQPRPVDEQIKADLDPHYRVYDATQPRPFETAQPSYHHKMVGGYHAAKLQRFADLIDNHFSIGNQAAFDMLNTKYFILPAGEGGASAARVQRNPGAMGNAWLVDSIAMVQTNNAEIDALNSLNLRQAAAIHQDFSDYVAGLNPNAEGRVSLTEYRPNKLTYSSNLTGEGLAVFSEMWYGPDKGWQAYIDGEAVDHIRANYALRALRVPAGQHEIVFEFAPKKYYAGITISSICSGLLLLGLLGFVVWQVRNAPPTPEAEPASAPKKPGKKTKTKKKKSK